jgi:hypothetical protein
VLFQPRPALFCRGVKAGWGGPIGSLLLGLGGLAAYQGLKGAFAGLAPAASGGLVNNSNVAPAGSTLSAAPSVPLGGRPPGCRCWTSRCDQLPDTPSLRTAGPARRSRRLFARRREPGRANVDVAREPATRSSGDPARRNERGLASL